MARAPAALSLATYKKHGSERLWRSRLRTYPTFLLSFHAHKAKLVSVRFIEKIRPLYYINMGGIISEKWCYFCSNLNTRKVEALGGHLFVPGRVGDVGIQKNSMSKLRPCQDACVFKISAKSDEK